MIDWIEEISRKIKTIKEIKNADFDSLSIDQVNRIYAIIKEKR